MILKALLLLIILYYIVRAVRSLLRAVQHDRGQGVRDELNRDRARTNGWQGPADSERRAHADVEDAKWVDL